MSKDLSIILSTYNEELFIEDTLKIIDEVFPNCEIILVDDNSKDQTIKKAENLNLKNLKIIQRNQRGLASAFLVGLIYSTKDILAWVDSNQGILVKKFPQMIEYLKEYDIVLLSRYVEGGEDKRTKKRILTSILINKFCRFLLGNKIKDYTSSMFVMNKSSLKHVVPIAYGHGEFFIEFLYKATKNNLKIKEVPFVQNKDQEELSKTASSIIRFAILGLNYIVRVFLSLIRKN
tara:strand:+ start:50 stop:748 length:699 start_codon:yes stop_codon:yes gene_type:complete